jgi:FKBP-type peptidyl-prolyl cis-trans isomerase
MLSCLLRILPRRSLITALPMLIVTPLLEAAPRGQLSAEDARIVAEKWPEALEDPSGIRYVVLQEGAGPRPRLRQRLSVLYRGSLLDGTVFSEALDPNDPFVFSLGANEVILGWEEAFADMRAGEKRLLIIPYVLGYGLRGNPPKVPNRATLIFEVELLKIE